MAAVAVAVAMASESISSNPDWANLLVEILTLVAKRLSAVDYACFSAVCTSWASIASPENGMPRPLSLRKNQPYLLFFGNGVGNCDQSDFCSLLDLQDNSLLKIESLPELPGKWIVGTQFGWLAVTDELCNPSLLNPFTRSQIKLPAISTSPDIDPVYDSEGSLTGYIFSKRFFPLEKARTTLVLQKIVLSSNPTDGDFEAVAISPDNSLWFAKPGEDKWNLWSPQVPQTITDVIYSDGKFLALAYSGDVYHVDLSRPYDSLEDSLFAKSYGVSSFTSYLVDSAGVLLRIVREEEFLDEENRKQTRKIVIRSLDAETGKWIRVSTLRDRSLFIGSWCSLSLSSKEVSWLEENRVYFIDDNWDHLPVIQEMGRDIGVFNLTNGSFEVFCPPDMRLTWPPPVWITSPQL